MGYYSYVRGSISFDPPLTHKEIQEIQNMASDSNWVFELDIEIRVRDTEEGELSYSTCNSIQSASEDQIKAYDAVEDLKTLVRRIPSPRTFNGEFRIEGEESGDIWRLRVVNGTVVEERAMVVWPDGTEAK